jgi:hypothetical protein
VLVASLRTGDPSRVRTLIETAPPAWQTHGRRDMSRWQERRQRAPVLAHYQARLALETRKKTQPPLPHSSDIKACDRAPRFAGIGIAQLSRR